MKEFKKDNLWNRDIVMENEVLNSIIKKGGSIWIDDKTVEYCFRRSRNSDIKLLNETKAKRLLSSYLNNEVSFGAKDGNLKPSMLETVTQTFDTDVTSEFYERNGSLHRTSWEPSELMMENEEGEFSEIKFLISNLCGGGIENEGRAAWVINWLAGMFQNLEKSQVALVLTSVPGAGKGIFFNKIIAPLVGEEYTVTVDDKRLNLDTATWISSNLFINMNELSYNKRSHKKVSSFVKQLITDATLHDGSMRADATVRETKANILITSNYTIPIPIEKGDRRFSVLSTENSLKSLGKDPIQMMSDIASELPAFAHYLSNYEVDTELYNLALETQEKRNIIQLIEGDVDVVNFVGALNKRDSDYFTELDSVMYCTVEDKLKEKESFTTNELGSIFKKLTGLPITATTLLKKMRTVDNIYDARNAIKSNENTYYRPRYAS